MPEEILRSCPYCGVKPIRANEESTVAVFLHREGCFFAPPDFEKPFLVVQAQFDKWNRREDE